MFKYTNVPYKHPFKHPVDISLNNHHLEFQKRSQLCFLVTEADDQLNKSKYFFSMLNLLFNITYEERMFEEYLMTKNSVFLDVILTSFNFNPLHRCC